MNQLDEEKVIDVIGGPITDITMSVVLLIHALKQQPNFDASLFDLKLEGII
ncbi:hypothetical protein [Pseudomonas azotoformans]